MMIDFALDADRNQGKTAHEATYQVCLLRFRPILITTMVPVLGALILMMGVGVGSELGHPPGISIFGGLLVSLVLTLCTMRIIYLWFDLPQQRYFNMDDAVGNAKDGSAEQGSPAQ